MVKCKKCAFLYRESAIWEHNKACEGRKKCPVCGKKTDKRAATWCSKCVNKCQKCGVIYGGNNIAAHRRACRGPKTCVACGTQIEKKNKINCRSCGEAKSKNLIQKWKDNNFYKLREYREKYQKSDKLISRKRAKALYILTKATTLLGGKINA